jgi:hypothetical protein
MGETILSMRPLALAFVATLALGCTPTMWSLPEAEDCPRGEPAPSATARSAERPVIMTLRTRDHDVVVHGGDDELRFTIALAGGTVLGRMLDAGAFEARFPELHRHFESAYAEEGVWAGL